MMKVKELYEKKYEVYRKVYGDPRCGGDVISLVDRCDTLDEAQALADAREDAWETRFIKEIFTPVYVVVT